MPKFIEQEINDFNPKNKKKCYYRLENKETLSLTDIAEHIAYPGSGVNKGTAMHVLEAFINEMTFSLSKGYTINIEGLGKFRVKLGIKNESETKNSEGTETKRNAASIEVSDIRFRADRNFIINTNMHCRLKKGETRKIKTSPYTKEERLKLALDFLNNPQNAFMRTEDYMRLTSLSKTKAREDLVEFRNDPDSGITCTGKGINLVYKKRLS